MKRIQRGTEADARRAMEEVCQCYWYPIYSYLRRSGHALHDAEDFTQSFFQRLVAEESLRHVAAENGLLRSFLLSVLKRLLSDHFRHHAAQKRGGGKPVQSLDAMDAEERYQREPVDVENPEVLYERAWAEGVLASALLKLRAACVEANNVEAYEHMREFLPLGDNATPYAAVGQSLGLSESVVRLQIHRMRKRYAKFVEEVIAQTVTDPAEVKTERDHLLAVMGR